MQLFDLHHHIERELRRYFRRAEGRRSRDQRWNALSARIAAYEQTQYTWVAPPMRWSDLQPTALVMRPGALWPRFIT